MKKIAGHAKTRVFLVDDHPIVRRGFQMLINIEPDMMVCGEADNVRAALDNIPAAKADVAIVDLSLKASSGLDLIKEIRVQFPKVKLLVFTMRDEVIYAERALHAGAHGYITKEEGSEKALEAIRALIRGKSYLGQTMTAKMVDSIAGGGSFGKTSFESLTDRELQILELIGSGLASREIAKRLHISVKTIDSHREHIKTKLGLKSASELVGYAYDRFRGGGGLQ